MCIYFLRVRKNATRGESEESTENGPSCGFPMALFVQEFLFYFGLNIIHVHTLFLHGGLRREPIVLSNIPYSDGPIAEKNNSPIALFRSLFVQLYSAVNKDIN